MGWRIPPPEVQRLIAQVAGDGIWQDLHDSRMRLKLTDPDLQFSNWYRDPRHNAAVGGAELSQHQAGLAFDVVPSPGRWQAVEAAARREGFIVIPETDHLHLQTLSAETWRRSEARRQLERIRGRFSER